MKSNIAKKLIIYTVLFSSAITLIITSIQLYTEFQYDVKGINQKLEQIKISYKQSITHSLWVYDREQLQAILNGITELPDIVYSSISTKDSADIISGRIPDGEKIESQNQLNYLYNNKNLNIGKLTVIASLTDVYSRLLNRLWVILLSNAFKTSLVAVFIYFLFSRLVTRHLSRISEFSEKHDPLSNNTRLSLNRTSKKHDEFDAVINSINTMHTRLHEQISEINQQKQYLSQTLNSIGDAVITTDADGKVTQLNPIAERLTGWTNEEAQKQPLKLIFSIVNVITREPIISPIENILVTGETVYLNNDTTLISKNSSEYQISHSAAAIHYDNNIIGMVLVFNDITEQYLMREELHESEQRLRQLTENINEVFWLGSPDWNEVIYISPAYEKNWGLNAKKLYKDSRIWIESVHPDDRQRVIEDIPQDIKDIKDCVEFREYRILKPNGEILWIKARAYPVYGVDGKIIRIAGIAEDITARIQAEEKLKTSSSLLKKIASRLPGMVYQFELRADGSMSFPYMSDAVNDLYQLSHEEIQKDVMQVFDMVHPDDIKKANDSIKESAQSLMPWKLEYRICRKNGDIRWLYGNSTPERTLEGGVLWHGFVTDITKNKEMDESLRRTQKMDALGKLTGGIAHDYNNMLSVIIGYADLLIEVLGKNAEQKKYVEQIMHACERGEKLTRKLLSFSRQKVSDSETMDINTVLHEQQHMLEKTLTARIQLKLKLDKNLWPVTIDGSELEDAVLNLCINAMHSISDNGKLIITTSNTKINSAHGKQLNLEPGDYVQLNITDTGCGMNETTKEKVFDPFYTTKGDKGTGLGLSQVYGFIKRCNGTISVESRLNRGTTFTLYFPKNEQQNIIKDINTSNDNARLGGTETILIVDDEPALLNLSSKILQLQGYKTFTAQSAKQALEIMKLESINLLISDVIMPEMDGYELASIVQEKYPKIKIQLTSGYNNTKHISNYDENLEKNLMQKPYNQKTLLEKVHTALQTNL